MERALSYKQFLNEGLIIDNNSTFEKEVSNLDYCISFDINNQKEEVQKYLDILCKNIVKDTGLQLEKFRIIDPNQYRENYEIYCNRNFQISESISIFFYCLKNNFLSVPCRIVVKHFADSRSYNQEETSTYQEMINQLNNYLSNNKLFDGVRLKSKVQNASTALKNSNIF